jgi:TFIIF-interacting CTD phosphatase-like protein
LCFIKLGVKDDVIMNKEKKLLILDIDETLIHAREEPLNYQWHFETDLYLVYCRPYLADFIDFCREHFQVAIWTTGGEEFAAQIVKNIFPEDYKLEFVWSQDRCTHYFNEELCENGYLKNLYKVKKKGFKLENVIMVDDTPSKLKNNYGNLVPMPEFIGNVNDIELLRLMKYLLDLKKEKNIRKVEKRYWVTKYNV